MGIFGRATWVMCVWVWVFGSSLGLPRGCSYICVYVRMHRLCTDLCIYVCVSMYLVIHIYIYAYINVYKTAWSLCLAQRHALNGRDSLIISKFDHTSTYPGRLTCLFLQLLQHRGICVNAKSFTDEVGSANIGTRLLPGTTGEIEGWRKEEV
jgi:hypothetical protein